MNNHIKLSLRSADEPRVLKEQDGVPIFASVFALHNAPKKPAIPITVKASRELAPVLVENLKKGTAFVVEGQLAYFKHPETSRENYSIWADNLTDITAPQSQSQKAEHEE